MKRNSLLILMLVVTVVAGVMVACGGNIKPTPAPTHTSTLTPTSAQAYTPTPTITQASTPTSTLTQTQQIPTNHLVFTMASDEANPGYVTGDIVNIQFEGNNRFVLSDKFGTFDGTCVYTGKTLTLGFDSYPAWYVTIVDGTHFTGTEVGKNDAGTYVWQ